jgi:toxin ParE1/3/4
MAEYRLNNEAKEDLKRIHLNAFFKYFDIIAQQPYSFESVDHIRNGYRRCACGSDSIYYRIINGMVEIMAIVGLQDLMKIL